MEAPCDSGSQRAPKAPEHAGWHDVIPLGRRHRCQLLIVHQDELEGYLTAFFEQQAPEIVGNDYLVIGTVDRPDWKRGAQDSATTEDLINGLHDFEDVLHFKLAPHWMPPK